MGTYFAAIESPSPERTEVIPGSPPPEVLAAVAVAAEAGEELRRSGRHVHFGVDGDGGVEIVLADRQGRSISRLSPVELLRAADGGSVDEQRRRRARVVR